MGLNRQPGLAFASVRRSYRRRPALVVLVALEYDDRHMKRTPTRSKDVTHDRIVDAAARAIRRSGYDGTGVADIMKEAGLTHGGFYAHFPSREAMLAEAVGKACTESAAAAAQMAAQEPSGNALASMLGGYLSRAHVDNVELG